MVYCHPSAMGVCRQLVIIPCHAGGPARMPHCTKPQQASATPQVGRREVVRNILEDIVCVKGSGTQPKLEGPQDLAWKIGGRGGDPGGGGLSITFGPKRVCERLYASTLEGQRALHVQRDDMEVAEW